MRKPLSILACIALCGCPPESTGTGQPPAPAATVTHKKVEWESAENQIASIAYSPDWPSP